MTQYYDTIHLIKINKAGMTGITAIIKTSELGLDLSEYSSSSFSDTMREKVHSALINKNVASIALFKTAFYHAVAEAKKTPGGSAVTGGGLNSRSGGTSFSIVPKITEEIPIVPENKSFSDFDEALWAKDSISYLADKNIINGFNDGTFKPNQNITREQFVKILVMSTGISYSNQAVSFIDVDSREWYYPYIALAVNLGIVNGYENNTFGICKALTRQEMSVMAYRTYDISKIKNGIKQQAVIFNDQNNISDYAKEAISQLQMLGVINGMDDNNFLPMATTTRAQAAKVIYNLFFSGGQE